MFIATRSVELSLCQTTDSCHTRQVVVGLVSFHVIFAKGRALFSLLAQADVVAGDFPGIDGFLGTRGSLMLDVVFLAMFVIVPVMGVSIYLVKYRRRYQLHKQIQLALAIVLLVAVTAFEIDMQWMTKWELRAVPSVYFNLERKWSCPVGISLIVHLLFAVPTAFLWIFVIVQAMRKFPNPIGPNEYSRQHVFWARLAAFEMLMTAITGWVFYTLAFVA